MASEEVSVPPAAVPAASGADATEAEWWAAELAFMSTDDTLVRSAQFAIRTAIRAQRLAELAHTNPIDELLDARAKATSDRSRRVFDCAINYLRTEQKLARQLAWQGN